VNQTPRSVLDPTIPMTLLGRADEVIECTIRSAAIGSCEVSLRVISVRFAASTRCRLPPESDHIAGRTPLLFASTIAAVDFPFDCGVR
jgi:hypothetical protein